MNRDKAQNTPTLQALQAVSIPNPHMDRWPDHEVFERICNAAELLCQAAHRAGHRWGCIYETQALIYGIRTHILADPT